MPNFIPGIFNYCDRWCERCTLRARCEVYLETKALGHSAAEQLLRTAFAAFRSTVDAVRASIAAAPGPPLSLGDGSTSAPALEDSIDRAESDPLVRLSLEYTCTATPILRALRPIVEASGDERSIDAVDVIEALCLRIASKTHRAVSGALDADYDPADVQSDANGSAKLVRLLIAESRAAWRVLMEMGRARANGVPAKLARMLEDLDVGIDVRFPNAMKFIRPGFDTVGR